MDLLAGVPAATRINLPPRDFLASYVATYVERDVRQVRNIGDLPSVQAFLSLCAGRASQVLNVTSIGSDAGIDDKTAKSWLSVLETSFLAFRLPPFFHNLGKRWIKAPKLAFFDSGLLCYLLGIREPDHLRTHPLRGAIFESWVVSEVYKARVHRGRDPDLYYWRDQRGREVDMVVLDGTHVRAVEIKIGKTVVDDMLGALRGFADLVRLRDRLVTAVEEILVYGGDTRQTCGAAAVLPWPALDTVDWARG